MLDYKEVSHSHNRNHVVGIIPCHTYKPLDFNFKWHDSLMPLAPDYTIVQHAIYQAAFSGCDSIWVVINKKTRPLMRHIIGDFVRDTKKLKPLINEQEGLTAHIRMIPIYYIGLYEFDHRQRGSNLWAALHGCYVARKIGRKMSLSPLRLLEK